MLMSVAPVMVQRNVEDCPFATTRGSAVKLAITALPPVSRGCSTVLGGGNGGGGGGTFFFHPAAKTRSASANVMAFRFQKCDLILSVIPSPLMIKPISLAAPDGLFVAAGRRELLLSGTIRKHSPDLAAAPALGGVCEMHAIRRPTRIFVPSFVTGQLHDIAGRNIHSKNVVVPGLESFRPGKRNMLAIRVPGRVGSFARSVGQTDDIRSVCIHFIYFCQPPATPHETDLQAYPLT